MGEPYEEGAIVEPEEWRNPEEQAFNHQVLVMTAIKKCLELGSKEMREGYWDDKIDKNGNVARTYHEDTRKSFIEAVKSLLMVTECDYDVDAKKKIPELQGEIATRRKHWIAEEWQWWCSLAQWEREYYTQQGKHVMKGFFNSKLSFDNYFFSEELDIYRKICSEVNQLTKRLDYYGEVGYTA